MALVDKSGNVLAVAIVFAVLTWVSVILRVYVRREHIGRLGLDDALVIVSQLLFTAYLACQVAGVYYGTGRHLEHISYDDAERALEFWFFCEIWYSLATMTVKVAICLSLLRVTVNKTHIWMIYGLIVWSICLGFSFFFGVIFQCNPATDWWSLDPDKKRCLPPHVITALILTVSALNIACDWTLGIFPFFIVKDLAIPLHQKIMVASILAFGALASTATIVRMFYLHNLDQTYQGWNGDFLYATAEVAIWTTVEGGVAITAICLATLRPLMTKAWRLFKPHHDTSYGYDYGDSTHLTDYGRSRIQVDDGWVEVPGTATTNGTFESTDLLTATQFNQTKPLSNRGDRHIKHKASPPPTVSRSANYFNATKALSSSHSEVENEEHYHSASSTMRRHHPT